MIGTNPSYSARIEKLFEGTPEKVYPKNQLIQYEGDSLSKVYLIKKGYVKVYTILDSGDLRTLMILSPGDIFPMVLTMSWDWEHYKIKNFYQTMTDAQLKIIDAQRLKRQVISDPEVKDLYMSYLQMSSNSILNQLEIMKSKKAINKVLLLLPYLISKLGQQIRPNVYQLKIKLSHQELADLSGVTRETTTTLIKKLEKSGKIKQKGGKLVIKTVEDEEKKLHEEV